ncbi:MAG: NINE protein [Thermaerobacter sp.]|nr:NINE protein [Thermaerobacter sp.]
MRNRLVAALLAILLGSFGVHKFYLGKIGQGVLYAIFFWTGIPAIVGFIDGIVYLVMSPEMFDDRYNHGLSSRGDDVMNQLIKLKELMDSGIISPSEYEERRQKLISRI